MSPDDLIYHSGALGDFITVWPALECRRELVPAGRTVLLSRAPHGRLAKAAGLVDDWWDIEEASWISLYRDNPQEAIPAAQRLKGIRSALVFAFRSSPLLPHLIHAGCQNLVQQDPFPEERCSAVGYHLRLFPPSSRPEDPFARLKALALGAVPPPDPSGRQEALIHPGSGSPNKNWPLDRFIEVAGRLKQEGFPVRWILGPAEDLELPGPCLTGADLQTLAGELARGALYLGNDSGVSHLAAAVGCPTVVIFGPTDPVVWAPVGDRVTVVTARTVSPQLPFEPTPMEAVELSAVWAAVQETLDGAAP